MNIDIKCGLWKKISSKGLSYFSGKITIENKEYYVNVFKNNKSKETSPDINLALKPKEEKEFDNVFKDFGEEHKEEEYPWE